MTSYPKLACLGQTPLTSVTLPVGGVAEGEHEAFVHAAGEVGVVDFCNPVVTEPTTSALARAVCAPRKSK